MKNVILDTCVFFGMLKYYKIYKRYGEQGESVLREVLEDEKHDIENLREGVQLKYGEVFKEKYKDLTFEEAVDHVKELYNDKKANLENSVKGLEKVAQGIDPKTGNHCIPLERQRKVLEEILPIRRAEKEKFDKEVESDVITEYKNAKNSLENGLLFLKVIRGEINPFVVQPGFDEILDHTESKNENPKWKVVDKILVNEIMRDFVTLISTHSEQFLKDVEALAAKFREPTNNDNSKEMAPDVNSNEVFGDSLIMAWASMAGMPLVTQNIKDFIRNKKIRQENDFKRKNIESVEQNVEFATDALPYSTREILDGKFCEAKRKNSAYELSEAKSMDYNYSLPRMQGTYRVPSTKIIQEK